MRNVRILYCMARCSVGASISYIALKLLKLADYITGSKTVLIPDDCYLVKILEVRT